MLIKPIAYGLSTLAIASAYMRNTPEGYRLFGDSGGGDTSVLNDSTSVMRLVRGTFGGDNLILNLGAAVGGHFGSEHLRKKAFVGALQDRSMRSVHSGVPLGKEAAFLEGVGRDPTPFKNPKAAYKDMLNTTKGMTDKGRMAKLGGGQGRMGVLSKATTLRRVARLATWAPMAFMAFSAVGSLGNMPAPDFQSLPRRSAALSGTFMDTSMATTQRKRALQAMHNTQYGGRSALANEASLIHS